MRTKAYELVSYLALLFSIFIISFSQQTSSGNLVGDGMQFNATENLDCDPPPKIELSGADTIFDLGSNVTVYALVTDRWNNPVDYWTYLNLSIYSGNNLVFEPTTMTRNATGWYYLNYTIPATVSYGSYSVMVEGDPCGVVTKATTGFRVALLNVSIVAGTLDEVLAYLREINATQTAYFPTWNTTFWTWNNSYFVFWNSTIIDLNRNISDLRNYWDCSGAGVDSLVCNYLDEINDTTHSGTTDILREVNQTVHYIWERFERVNATQQIHNETVLSAILSKSSNIKLWYNLTIPLKQGYTADDYLPLRIKYWFINLGSDIGNAADDACVNQARTFENALPYCNPIIAQYVGKGSSTVNFNVTLQPSLGIGNYSIVREIEIDPNNVWLSYSFGTIGSFEVTDDMQVNLTDIEIQATGSEDGKWSYMDKSGMENFRVNVPTQSIVRLWGSVRGQHNEPFNTGSLKITLTDTFLPEVTWSETYDDAVTNGIFSIPLGAKKPLSMISGREYELNIIACNGRIFDAERYSCSEFTTYVTPE